MSKCLTVGDLREFLNDCNISDDANVYIVSDDEMPVRKVIDISSEEQVGYYKEVYLNTVELND